ncbi:Sensor kinase CckA [Frigidibacter albus]
MHNGKPVVLVVEDSPIIRMGAVDLVLLAGYEALEARDADEAIRILESRADIDLVFTDVQMPGTMDGLKLSHYIRDRWPPVKLIVASGNAILEESSLPAGSRFFPKPYR